MKMSFFIGFITSDYTEAKAEVFTSKNDEKTNFRDKTLKFMCWGKASPIKNIFKMSSLPAICHGFEKPFCGKKTTAALKLKNPSKTHKPFCENDFFSFQFCETVNGFLTPCALKPRAVIWINFEISKRLICCNKYYALSLSYTVWPIWRSKEDLTLSIVSRGIKSIYNIIRIEMFLFWGWISAFFIAKREEKVYI